MKNRKAKASIVKKSTPFIYRSFLNFWMVVVLPATILALVISKLYYNNTINFEPLREPYTWLHFGVLQVFLSFFTYLWVYRIKSKRYKS